MMFKNVSFRVKILLSMLSVSLLGFFLLLASKYYESKKDEINAITSKLHVIELDIQSILQDKSDFLLYETINPEFFQDKQSPFIDKIKANLVSIENKLVDLDSDESIKSIKQNNLIPDLIEELNKFQYELDLLVTYTLKRGFKDFGVEGKMREFAHQIENDFEEIVESADILMLRRHEKDFILRKEMKYLDKFNAQAQLVRTKIKGATDISSFTSAKVCFALDQYKVCFDSLVSLENSIRIKEENILSNLDRTGESISLKLNDLQLACKNEQALLLASLENKFIIGLLIFAILICLVSIRLSSKLTAGINKLSKNVKSFVESKYKVTADYKGFRGKDEIAELAKNLKVLEDEIVIHFGLYKSKVEKRTNEILRQKSAIETKQAVIEQKNDDIISSIRYARKIQESILPKARFMRELLPEHFIIYQPKDIVSGDFYWVERSHEKVYLAVSDCTGHGVPGAFMSIMGNNFLNQALNEKKLKRTDQILNYLNVSIASVLQQQVSVDNDFGDTLVVQDGMDIAIISIDYSNNIIEFSGAQRPLLHVSDNELFEYKGDRFPVGGSSEGDIKRFTTHVIEYSQNDCVYLFSDGYADQFGGEHNKKFKYQNLRNLIMSCKDEKMSIQEQVFQQSHDIWKGDREQIDDICLLGIRF